MSDEEINLLGKQLTCGLYFNCPENEIHVILREFRRLIKEYKTLREKNEIRA